MLSIESLLLSMDIPSCHHCRYLSFAVISVQLVLLLSLSSFLSRSTASSSSSSNTLLAFFCNHGHCDCRSSSSLSTRPRPQQWRRVKNTWALSPPLTLFQPQKQKHRRDTPAHALSLSVVGGTNNNNNNEEDKDQEDDRYSSKQDDVEESTAALQQNAQQQYKKRLPCVMKLWEQDENGKVSCYNLSPDNSTRSRISTISSPLKLKRKISQEQARAAAALAAAVETYNWCAEFVVPQDLCPWAAQSVQQSDQAIRIHVVVATTTATNERLPSPLDIFGACLSHISLGFSRNLQQQELDPNTAIDFIVLAPILRIPVAAAGSSSFSSRSFSNNVSRNANGEDNDAIYGVSFGEFYDWFCLTEDAWFDAVDEGEDHHPGNFVTLAPFHPNWRFAGDDEDNDEVLQFEKKSPHPTVSLVSTAVIDKAGSIVTEKIADHNAFQLQQKTAAEWEIVYDHAVYGKGRCD